MNAHKFIDIGSVPIPRGNRKLFDEYAAKPKRMPAGMLKLVQGGKTKFDAAAPINIEGWGNYALADRCDEIMPASCWDLTNFLKNSIYLWNHNHDEPIGLVGAIEAKEEGLWFAAQVGMPLEGMELTDAQKKARSLLAQGIVKMNSVGFLPKRWHEDDDGNLVYDEVELLEISLVPIPMQQDSVLTNVKHGDKNMTAKTKADESTDAKDPMLELKTCVDEMKGELAAVKEYCKNMHAKICEATTEDDKPAEDSEPLKALKKRIAELEGAVVSAHTLLKKHNLVG